MIGWIEEAAIAVRPPADGPLGQRRLLGHRDQARAGARACRLSGVHAQGHDRSLLHGLRRESCSRRASALYPQFATHNALTVASVIEDAGGVEGFEFQRLHGMGEALYAALLAELPRSGVPRLRAGRRPPRSARLSGAAAAGEWRQFLVRLGRRRSQACRSKKFCAVRKIASASRGRDARNRENSAAARSLCSRSGATPPASSSASAQASTHSSPKFAPARRSRRSRTARRRHRAAPASSAR